MATSIVVEQKQAHNLLAKAQAHAADVHAALAGVLGRSTTSHETYVASPPVQRRILKQAFFKRILIGEDTEVLGTTLAPAYGPSPTAGSRPSANPSADRPASPR